MIGQVGQFVYDVFFYKHLHTVYAECTGPNFYIKCKSYVCMFGLQLEIAVFPWGRSCVYVVHSIKAPLPPNPEGSRLWRGQVPNHGGLRLALVGISLVCRPCVSLLFWHCLPRGICSLNGCHLHCKVFRLST